MMENRDVRRPNFAGNKARMMEMRPPNRIDSMIDHAIVFTQRLAKQLAITFGVAALKAAADWLMQAGDQKAQEIFKENINNNDHFTRRSNNYGSSYSGSNSYYNRQSSYSTGTESFPGFPH